MTSETDAEFVERMLADFETFGFDGLDIERMRYLARRGAEAAARIERLEAALQYIAWEQKEGDEPHLIARAALEERT